MKKNMKFGVLVADKKAEVHEHEIPDIGDDEVLIHNKSCNICTHDYQQWLGLRPQQPYPMAWGHEQSGIVADMGKKVKYLEIGDQVVDNIYRPCLECANCRKGLNMHLCLNRPNEQFTKDKYGYYGHYGCGQYEVVHQKHVVKVEKNIPFEEAGFTEPLATVLQGIERLSIQPSDHVLVIGAGTMGLLNAQVARYFGAEVIISELMENKIQTAQKLHFDKIINPSKEDLVKKINDFTNNKGPSTIIFAVGDTKAYEQGFNIAPRNTKFLIFAANFPAPQWTVDPNLVHYKFWQIIGTYGASLKNWQDAVELLSYKKINVTSLIEKRFSLMDIQKAFESAATPGTYRTAVMIP
ncbi:MAG: alcohol dehydrogenase catalytic domain-containing protein [Candidatus Atribacteria bacterium]|nr:alcohol dehydrogenase catalytic domain-containing protein [Candidatus Atribacteria bacterium]